MEQLGLDLAPARQVFSVSEVTSAVRGILEDAFYDVWVRGEISNFKAAPSGHYYFTLKDADAQLRCVCFRQHARYLKLKPKAGLAVMVRGRISVYEARGEYQLYVEHLEPEGLGALQQAFEDLKKKLAAEGLFDDERKRPLPEFPRTIGIVTSPAGAVIADMLRVLERRFQGLRVLLYPVRVQGEGAAQEISEGLRYFSEQREVDVVDVVIVGRGGGSIEDLWAFNEEIVARAIAACRVPVISAVGHQTDFTIADFVADVRAPTPSVAAEIVIAAKQEFLDQLDAARSRLAHALRYKLAVAAGRLLEIGLDRAVSAVRRKIGDRGQRADELDFRLRRAAERRLRFYSDRLNQARRSLAALDLRVRLAESKARLERSRGRIAAWASGTLQARRAGLDSLGTQLGQLSPLAILNRGYAIVQTASGNVVRSAGETAVGDPLGVRLHQGELRVRVEDRKPE